MRLTKGSRRAGGGGLLCAGLQGHLGSAELPAVARIWGWVTEAVITDAEIACGRLKVGRLAKARATPEGTPTLTCGQVHRPGLGQCAWHKTCDIYRRRWRELHE